MTRDEDHTVQPKTEGVSRAGRVGCTGKGRPEDPGQGRQERSRAHWPHQHL